MSLLYPRSSKFFLEGPLIALSFMNGETIYSQATEEVQRLEEQIQLAFETPIDYMMG